MKDYLERVDGFLIPFLDKEGYILVKSEFVEEEGNFYLRAYIDFKEKDEEKGGISINDCVKVSRWLGKRLDKEDFIKEAYTLEVCSPGFLNPEESDKSEE